MWTPNKYVTIERSLMGLAALIVDHKAQDQTVSELWNAVSEVDQSWTFDQFALALSLLYGFGIVDLVNGLLTWETP